MPPEIRGDGGCFYSYCIANDSLVGAFGTVCRRRFVIFWSTNTFCAVRAVVDAVVFADAAPFRQRGHSKGLWITPGKFRVSGRNSMRHITGRQEAAFGSGVTSVSLYTDFGCVKNRVEIDLSR